MHKTLKALLPILLIQGAIALPSWSAATAEQVASLGGKTYTPVGAERRGNADGSIPVWQNGLSETPAGNSAKIPVQANGASAPVVFCNKLVFARSVAMSIGCMTKDCATKTF